MVSANRALHELNLRRAGWLARIREFLYGLIGYEFAHTAIEERGALETLFILITVGDLIGVPILPPYYSLRILPFVVPQIATWKRRVLRERMPTDAEEFDLHVV
ncbi:MAG: hypothetical protein HY259_10785 [Chloroflexi bacterium]|nr:hypothetical protein [Chloroflexota bacterium]